MPKPDFLFVILELIRVIKQKPMFDEDPPPASIDREKRKESLVILQ